MDLPADLAAAIAAAEPTDRGRPRRTRRHEPNVVGRTRNFWLPIDRAVAPLALRDGDELTFGFAIYRVQLSSSASSPVQ